MKIYLAAPYAERHAMMIYASLLRADGHVIVSSWVDRPREDKDDGKTYLGTDQEIRTWALEDWSDLLRADVLIHFTLQSGGLSRGGRHWETGAAFALDKRIIIIGPREIMFYYMDRVEHFAGWADFVKAAPLTQPDPVARRPR